MPPLTDYGYFPHLEAFIAPGTLITREASRGGIARLALMSLHQTAVLTPTRWNSNHTNPPGGLANYYRNNVIGGPGAFVMVAENSGWEIDEVAIKTKGPRCAGLGLRILRVTRAATGTPFEWSVDFQPDRIHHWCPAGDITFKRATELLRA